MSNNTTTEPRGCPTPGACSAVVEIERLRGMFRRLAEVGGATDQEIDDAIKEQRA